MADLDLVKSSDVDALNVVLESLDLLRQFLDRDLKKICLYQ